MPATVPTTLLFSKNDQLEQFASKCPTVQTPAEILNKTKAIM